MNTVLESSKVILFRVALHDEILVNLELLCVVTFLNCTFSMTTVLSISLKKLFEDMELVNLTPSIIIVEKAELRIEPWLVNMVSLNIFKYPEVTCKFLSETSYSNRLEFWVRWILNDSLINSKLIREEQNTLVKKCIEYILRSEAIITTYPSVVYFWFLMRWTNFWNRRGHSIIIVNI